MRHQNPTSPDEESAASSPILFHALQPANFLSYGPDAPEIPLCSLNILIGPNGSGKSNFIEALCLLLDTASDVQTRLRTGGGVAEWIWKGRPNDPAYLGAVISNEVSKRPLRHSLAFTAENQSFRLIDEKIEYAEVFPPHREPFFFYKYENGNPVVSTNDDSTRKLARETVDADQSILAQRRDPEVYPEITRIAALYNRVRAYREWSFGRSTVFRVPQRADLRTDRMEEDFSNLGLFLNRLRRNPEAKNTLLSRLRDIYDGVDDFDVSIEGGTVQVFFTEGRFTIPATRLSDGTLRYLCLLAILCDPTPPPLICIEEPELGLHPDIIPKIADLLREASTRTQLIVTTHSDILVDAMTSTPEVVLVCEKHDSQTELRRLSSSELSGWLEKYRLGELWMRGELGGTRW